ncbi:hypothetical protein NGB36_02980 [Streptomyces sp. RB6PN25]|uniref:Secreted protein n=1 Tax=Streptomyces humicola TaxID=2953240 RepID=A0ABT1PPI9_9ACTN|nr:hypothetical protein [Streptomyces humicola]MCQ4079591.1 hypothetical protein [Streptomyces humicola]
MFRLQLSVPGLAALRGVGVEAGWAVVRLARLPLQAAAGGVGQLAGRLPRVVPRRVHGVGHLALPVHRSVIEEVGFLVAEAQQMPPGERHLLPDAG